jgi:hypothetical protein|tara:strand:- start:49 stop:510 length:462 start_codon:yes stop_codon:yes gene_type:complete
MGRDKKEMKRINPETELPFKCGNIREDGFIFDCYDKTSVRKSGYYKEIWRSPKQHAKEMQRKKDSKKIKYDLISEHINNLKLKKGCNHCGYNKHPIALDFHHLNKLFKEKNVSSYWRTSWAQFKQIENEIEKCEVLCANCHRVEEQRLRNGER